MIVTDELSSHIIDKINYHEKLRVQLEASEEYEKCVYHRDEVKRLKAMLD